MLKIQVLSICFALVGSLLILGIRLPKLPRISLKGKTRELSRMIEEYQTRDRRKGKETANEYVARIDGRTKESFIGRSYREAKYVYNAIGQSDRYQRTLEISLLSALGGILAGLLLGNLLLAGVLGVGFYFLPLWLSRFTLYRYQQFTSEELETSLSLITTSYLRSNDILSAIEENLSAVKEPVLSIFISFCNNLKYVDANAPAQIELMKSKLDNKLFWEWCDILILCQDNHLLQAALPPVVSKFSILKAQQEANETRMTEPLKLAFSMASLVVLFCPLMKLVNQVWYDNLMHTFPGQCVLAGAAITVFITINKGISLCEPISYDV